MASSVTERLALGAALFGGLLAGVTANRALVQMPAWERIGVISWASFTRAENHGIGMIFYPVLGGAALFFTVAAAVAFRFDRKARGLRGAPIYAAAVLAVSWAVITRVVLVPAMSSVGEASTSAAELQRLFLNVARWSGINDMLHALTFVANLWALRELLSSPNGSPVASGRH
jgi:hypothetical protein